MLRYLARLIARKQLLAPRAWIRCSFESFWDIRSSKIHSVLVTALSEAPFARSTIFARRSYRYSPSNQTRQKNRRAMTRNESSEGRPALRQDFAGIGPLSRS